MLRVSKEDGVSLIIVIFAMILFSGLAWTLLSTQSGQMDSNARSLDSERALGVAEAGAQWALRQVYLDSAFRTNGMVHTLPFGIVSGQYRVTCSDGTGTEAGFIVIVSTGYIPTQARYRALREVKILVELSTGLSKVVGCSLFNWSAAKAAHSVDIEGEINAENYNGDGNATYNQVGTDYSNAAPLLPAGSGARNIDNGIVTIPMQWYHDNADCEWPNPGTRRITYTADSTSSASTVRVVGADAADFFTGMEGQVVRNVDHLPPVSGAHVGEWADADWAVIKTVLNGGKDATLDKVINDTWDNHRIRLARRYSAAHDLPVPAAPESGREDNGGDDSGINYIGAMYTHHPGEDEYEVDTVIDVRSHALSWTDVKIISEGDIFITGSYSLNLEHSESGGSGGHRHPPLGTQNGNIVCLDATTSNNRQISGLIFSETGTVNWNYLEYPTSGTGNWLRGNMVYGQTVILDGDISLMWRIALVPPDVAKFGASAGSIIWQEQ
jgi:hypothetical protein